MTSCYSHPPIYIQVFLCDMTAILTPENMVNRLAKVIIRFPLKKGGKL